MKLIDTNRYHLPGTNGKFLHIATVHAGVREFMCFADIEQSQVYIEEITGGQLHFIEDDSLADGISAFLTYHGVLDLSRPLLPDEQWLYKTGKK